MITRLTHAAIAFAVVAVLYQGYVLAVAPFIEPAWRVAQATATPVLDDMMTSAEALHRYRPLLTAYFPADHWCFAKPPRAFDNGQALIIFSDYTETESGKLEVPKCAVIFFPSSRTKSEGPPRDAIIMESELGASLQMEAQNGDFGFGRIQHGVLNGKVTIHSDMSDPGPEDDLLLTTDNLMVNEDGIHTLSPVNMRLGPHNGFGRELEIRFSKAEGPGATGLGGIYGKLAELVVKHDVRVTAQLAQPMLLDGPAPQSPAPQGPSPPIHIQSVGPFRINFEAKVASFNEQVRARQTYPDGKLDQLLANELKLFFTETSKWNAEADGVAPTGNSGSMSMGFEPATIEALGAPVTLSAQSRDAAAEGERLYIELGPRRITLEGGNEVRLSHQGAEIHAPMVRYTLPAKDSGQKIGALAARGGAGWIKAIPDPAQPYRVLDVHWTDAMNLVRNEGQPVLILDGRPRVGLVGTGMLWADRLEIFLREIETGDPTGTGNPLSGSVVPEVIKASDNVAIKSSQLTGEVNELKVRIDHGQAAAASSAPANGQIAATPVSTGGPAASAPAAAAATANPLSLFGAGGSSNGKSYDIQGVTLDLDVTMQGKTAALRGINVNGNVRFKETSPLPPGEQPMQIAADRLKVTGADTPNAQIEIIGGGGQNGIPQQIAELSANGAKLRVPALAVQRGSSQAQVNSPGEVQLLVDRDMAGNPLARPEPLQITWQDSMILNGAELTFLGDVRVQHSTGWLNTRRLVVRTVAPVDFGGGANGQKPQLEQLECWEGVVAEFDQRDVTGITSRQHVELQAMQVNQLSGEIRGNGPGSIDSIHLAKGASGLMVGGGATAAAAPRLMNEEVKLRHLHIDFVRGIGGNLHQKNVKVIGNVEAVYGPVDNWEQRLAMSPGGNPGPDTVWITCDELGVTESPMAKLSPEGGRQVELNALGKVVLEGQDKLNKIYSATGGSATFDQSKGLFILEGTESRPAVIEHQAYAGAPKSPQSAQRILYNQNNGVVEAQGLHHASSINPAPK